MLSPLAYTSEMLSACTCWTNSVYGTVIVGLVACEISEANRNVIP